MPESRKKVNPRRDTPKGAPKDGPRDGPVPQDDADECETNDGMPSGGKRKPKCHEGYPEQQPTDTDAG